MTLLASGLLGFAAVDLIRWSPEPAPPLRAAAAVLGGVTFAAALLGLSGWSWESVIGFAGGEAAVLGLWVTFDYGQMKGRPKLQLSLMAAVLVTLFALSGEVAPLEGPLADWYSGLDLGVVESVPVDQFVLGMGSGLFLTASANRIVRLVLEAAAVRWDKGEEALAGGRVLGPLERLMVAAIVLAGDLAAAAIVVTAKGLLRFPEIRSESEHRGPDQVTEYFLIGTFASLFVAATLAVLVLAAG